MLNIQGCNVLANRCLVLHCYGCIRCTREQVRYAETESRRNDVFVWQEAFNLITVVNCTCLIDVRIMMGCFIEDWALILFIAHSLLHGA